MNDVGDVFDVINGGIYFLEGNYKDAAVSIAAAVPGLGTGATIAKAAATGLKAVGASEKVAAKVGCKIGSAIQAAPHAVVAALSYEQGKEQLKEGNYLGAMMSFVSMGSSLYRAKNVGTYCFTEGTQVVVGMEYDPDGNFVQYVTVNIEDVQVGDLVYSYDTATGEVSQKAVVSTSALRSDHINKLTIIDENGIEQVLETTDTHPFWVVTDEPDLEREARDYVFENDLWFYHENIGATAHGFWVEAKDLKPGDVFIGANGELSTLIGALRLEVEGGINVFNFTVEGNHNYFILAKEYEYGQTCVLVHNSKVPCTQTIVWANDARPYAKNIRPEKGFNDLVIHGTPKKFAVFHNGKWEYLTQRDIANFLKSKGITGNIRLISCDAGKGNLAQDLANKLGVTVKAATSKIKIYLNGFLQLMPGGKWQTFIPGGNK